jgi:nucleotide-binding universal stress UspA family protein
MRHVSHAWSRAAGGADAVLSLIYVGVQLLSRAREAAGSQQKLPVGRQRHRVAEILARALRGDVLIVGAHHGGLRRHRQPIRALRLGNITDKSSQHTCHQHLAVTDNIISHSHAHCNHRLNSNGRD